MSRYFLASAAIEGFRGINNDGDPLVLKFKHDAVNSVHAPGDGESPRMWLWISEAGRDQSMRVSSFAIFFA